MSEASDEKDTVDVRAALRKAMDEGELSLKDVARAVDKSTATIGAFLRDKYEGDNDALTELVRGYVARLEARAGLLPKRVKFLDTSVSRKIFNLIDLAHTECDMAVLTGEYGMGKTVALQEYARRNPDVALVEVDAGYSPLDVFTDICKHLDIVCAQSLGIMRQKVLEKLTNSGRLIMVDEAEHLNKRSLEMLRRLHDKAGIGLLLAGQKRLYHNLKKEQGEYGQLFSRVGMYMHIADPLTEEDCKAVVLSRIPKAKEAVKAFFQFSNGNARKLDKLIRRAVRVAELNKQTVMDAETVESAAAVLMY